MSFLGTQQKCKACDKTVYPVDQLSSDGSAYHKACFSWATIPPWKVFFTVSLIMSSSSRRQTKSPSKAASMFYGTQEKCAACGKTAYPLEKPLRVFCIASTTSPSFLRRKGAIIILLSLHQSNGQQPPFHNLESCRCLLLSFYF
ncbi:hypothetical protein RJT34_11402 [Clitoria ternatea]|uniref:LIM zinc-binding domain-containing protein n=1 Tax=Clitoria ternatea TaxID=43366 RepID=A0AAN9JM08_CLITE